MQTHGTGPTPSTAQALLTFRIIGASLGVGVTLFAFVSWFLHQQGDAAASPPGDPAVLFTAFLGLAVAAIVAAILFWRARVAPLIERPAPPEGQIARAGAIQTQVIIVWALAEAPALFGVILYFLYGNALAGILGLMLIWSTVSATWPKREWFESVT